MRTLFIITAAAIAVSGGSLYSIFRAQRAFEETTRELDGNRRGFLEMRLALEQTPLAIDAGNTVHAKESLLQAQERFVSVIEATIRENHGKSWALRLDEIRSAYMNADPARADVAVKTLQELRSRMDDVRIEISNDHRRRLDETMIWLISLIVPTALIGLVLPVGSVWFTMRSMTRELGHFVAELSGLSHRNDQTSESLRSAAMGLAEASGEQTATVQESVASIAEIRQMLAQTSSLVRELQSLTIAANEKTQNGSQTMRRMEASMAAIDESNAQLRSLEDIIQSIQEKTKIINDIVFKTQLLSFNASIEAARAVSTAAASPLSLKRWANSLS
ncbi:MAG: hypothetical protein HC902_05160 [Calothrix sp. SM1_5_4]|nr:hypothetical protein [Calothrix sp. SM1_5_4]